MGEMDGVVCLKARHILGWIVPAYFGIQWVLLRCLSDQFYWFEVIWLIVAPLIAAIACLQAAQRVGYPTRMLWRMLAGALILPMLAYPVEQIPAVEGASPVPGLGILINTFYGVVLLLTISLQFGLRVLRLFRLISIFLVLASGGLCFILVFSATTLRGSLEYGKIRYLIDLFDAIDLFLAVAATIRMLGAELPEKRKFFQCVTLFLWGNGIVPGIHNHLLLRHPFVWLDMLVPVPYLFLMFLARSGPPDWMERVRPSQRTAVLIRIGITSFLNLGLLLLGIAVSRERFWLGTMTVLVAVLFYVILNLVTQSSNLAAEESLLEAKEKLEELASLDTLTGISNRRTFNQRIEMECHAAHRSKQPLSLLMIDIDYFKKLNDTCGHLRGDACLTTVAASIRTNLTRTTDLAARYGGEEFVVLLPATDHAGASAVARKLHLAIASLTLENPAAPLGRITVSIGSFTTETMEQLSPAKMLHLADQALYRAKEEGRNRTVLGEDDSIQNSTGVIIVTPALKQEGSD